LTFGRNALLGLAGGLIAVLLSGIPVGEFLELRGYDLLHLLKGRGSPSREIVLVAIDEPSLAELGLQWPWPRSLHGRLIGELRSAGVSVVGFDIIFSEPSSPSEDAVLAAAIGEHGAVVLASDIETVQSRNYVQEIVVEPLPRFTERASSGLATVTVDRDHVVRRLYSRKEGERHFGEEIALRYAGKAFPAPGDAYISYHPPGSYPMISYYQALHPREFLPEGALKGKIAVVGRVLKTSPEPGRPSSDLFATPYLFAAASSLMSGAEIQANIVDNFLHGEFLSRLGRRNAILLYLLMGLSCGLLQWRWRPLRSGLLTAIAALIYLAAASYVFLEQRVWVPTVLMLFAFGIPYSLGGIQAYHQSEARRREIRTLFSHYLSPAVLESLLANPGRVSLAGRKVEATVLFCDIAGFTSLSEKLAPEDVARLLNRYFGEATNIIFAHMGTVDKFIGDAVMAFWGDPLPDPDQAYHACAAALAIQDRIRALREEAEGEGFPGIEVRIGINAGDVIAGNMGSPDLFNYTVVGETVNVASRLEQANKDCGTRILISGSVREKAEGRIATRSLGSIPIRGKRQSVEIHELIGLAAAPPSASM